MEAEIGEMGVPETSFAAGVLARGMRDNPGHVAVFGPDPWRRCRALATSFAALLPTMRPQPIVARRNGWIVGVAGLASPRSWHFYSPGRVLRGMPLAVRYPGAAIRGLRILRNWRRRDPPEPHWHLGPVAVEAGLQGLGIGSRLMAAFCSRVDATGTPAYLETDKRENVFFYERFGFQVVAEDAVLSVPMWFMWRASAASGEEG